MSRGSKPGERRGGRKKGTPNKATAKREAEITASGLTPLDYMLNMLRDKDAVPEDRKWAAAQAAPYVHPRLASVEHSGDLTHTHEHAEPAQAAAEATDIFHSPAGKPNSGDKVVH